MEKAPGIRGFVSQFPTGSQPMEDFYDRASRSRQMEATARFLKNSFRLDDLVDYMESNYSAMMTNDITEDYASKLAELRKQRDIIINVPGIPMHEREEMMERLDEIGYGLVAAIMTVLNRME